MRAALLISACRFLWYCAEYEQPMNRIWTLCVALGCGIAAETVLGTVTLVSILCGGIGPCGPTGNIPIPISAIHQPGFWISGYLVEDSSPLYLPLAVAITGTLLSVLAYFVLRFFLREKKANSPA
jgi:hypothetical protein